MKTMNSVRAVVGNSLRFPAKNIKVLRTNCASIRQIPDILNYRHESKQEERDLGCGGTLNLQVSTTLFVCQYFLRPTSAWATRPALHIHKRPSALCSKIDLVKLAKPSSATATTTLTEWFKRCSQLQCTFNI